MANIFWSNLFKRQDRELQTIVRLWQKTPLFANIPARHIEFLTAKMHIRNFLADEVIFRCGSQGAGAVLILSGSVRIMINQTELALLENGDFFGEIALAHTEQRIADAVSIGDTRLIFFLKQDLEEWIEYEPQVGTKFLMNLASVFAYRLFEANKIISSRQL